MILQVYYSIQLDSFGLGIFGIFKVSIILNKAKDHCRRFNTQNVPMVHSLILQILNGVSIVVEVYICICYENSRYKKSHAKELIFNFAVIFLCI